MEALDWAHREGNGLRETTPQVELIARPSIDFDALERYLDYVGGESWLEMRREQPDGLSPGELLIEVGGRACYRSWKEGLNPNVTRIRRDAEQYFLNLLRSGHGSVLEHANYSFIVYDVSRILTHELVRHRAGSAFSQESLRFVRLQDLGFRIPEVLEPLRSQVVSIVETLEEFQIAAAEHFGLDDEGIPFHHKKEITSALRRLAPEGLSTVILWTANVRTLRHTIAARTDPGAEEEIRLVFDKIGRIMVQEAPLLFGDFTVHDGAWTTEYKKV
jgi:thymidylate synthase (FAD)